MHQEPGVHNTLLCASYICTDCNKRDYMIYIYIYKSSDYINMSYTHIKNAYKIIMFTTKY